MATLVGTGPNLILAGQLSSMYPAAPQLSFALWFVFGFPLAMLMLVITYFILMRMFVPNLARLPVASTKFIRDGFNALERITFAEVLVAIHFVLLIALWFLRDPTSFAGWGKLFKSNYTSDGTAAMIVALLLFFAPADRPFKGFVPGVRAGKWRDRAFWVQMAPKRRILTWADTKEVPWGVVLGLGGGFALAEGFRTSGLSTVLGHGLLTMGTIGRPMVIVVCTTVVLVLTEFQSNSSACTIVLPLMASMSQAMEMNPLMMLIPSTVASSFAFMLPAATPPNAIVYATGLLRMTDMASAGLYINIAGLLLVFISTYTIGDWVFHLTSAPPLWALSASARAALFNQSATAAAAATVAKNATNATVRALLGGA